MTVASSSSTTLEALWEAVGGNPGAARTAAAVALAESGGRPDASNTNSNGTIDRGLWQVNSIHGPLSTFDPTANARAAVQISSNGTNWQPWCTAWSDGACGQKGGTPPPPGGLAPGSPAARMLSGAAGATIAGGTGSGSSSASSSSASSIGPQGIGGLVVGIVEALAGGALLLVGIVLAARTVSGNDSLGAGVTTAAQRVPIVGRAARSDRADARLEGDRRSTAAVELDARRRRADASAAASESRASAASARAVNAHTARRPAGGPSGPRARSRTHRPPITASSEQRAAARRERGLPVSDPPPPF